MARVRVTMSDETGTVLSDFWVYTNDDAVETSLELIEHLDQLIEAEGYETRPA